MEDNKILSYYLVNIAIVLTDNAQDSYKEKITNWGGLFYWILQSLRVHSLFCDFHKPNFNGVFFDDLNNMNCGFMAPQSIENDLTGPSNQDLYNYLLDNVPGVNYLNENLKYTKQSNLNISQILLNFKELINMLNINKLNNNNTYIVKHVKHVAGARARVREIDNNFLNQIKINKSNDIIDISNKNLGYQICYPYKLDQLVNRNIEKKEKKVAHKKEKNFVGSPGLENMDNYLIEAQDRIIKGEI